MLSTVLLVTTAMVAGQMEQEGPTADDYFEFVEYYVGNWNATIRRNDEMVKATVSIEWSPMKRCQIVKIIEDGKVTRHAIWGFDPEKKRWCGMAYNADGSCDLNVHGPRMLKAKYGKAFNTKTKGAKADGSPLIGSWTTTLFDENTYEVKVYEHNGNKRDLMLELHLEREKK